MPAIKLTGFSGEQPRIIPRLMPDTAAQSAMNCRLDDGALTPFRKSSFIADTGSSDAVTIYKFGDDWLSWPTKVNAAPGPVADDRLYYTGDGVPKMRIGGDVYSLAVPPPDTALTATLGGSGSGDVVTRLYAYTWVTDFGEESEPCPASNEIQWQPGNTVTLSGFAAAPAGRNITRQRIYRSQTSTSGTGLYLIEDRAASTSDYSDTVAVDAFQELLPSLEWNAPPDDLAGLVALPNGMMAAFRGKQLYFSEPWHPHAWPEKYVLTTDAEIVGLGAMGLSLVVLTKGQPYMASGSTPDTMQMVKIEQNLPCINANSIVDLGFAIAYASNEGLVVVKPDGTCALATANIFSADDWRLIKPETMIGGQLSGRYAAFYANTLADGTKLLGTLLIDLSGSSFLIRSSVAATAAYYDIPTGALFFLKKGTTGVHRYDAPDAERETLYWKSKQFVLPYEENFGAIRIDVNDDETDADKANAAAAIAAVVAANEVTIAAGSILGEVNAAPLNTVPFAGDILVPIPRPAGAMTVRVYADRVPVATITKGNEPKRLPAGFRARTWEVDVSANVQIQQIMVAKTMDELKATP